MALNYHVVPERYIASQFLGGLGAGMEWWLDQFWQNPIRENPISRADRYASFNNALATTKPGSNGVSFQPVSGTPRTNWAPGGYSGLNLNHNRADMGRAVLESAAFELRWALDEIRAFEFPIDSLWMVGGANRNTIWPQIIADVTGLPISLTRHTHGPALGAALLATKGLGLLDEFPYWVSPTHIDPNPKHKLIYDKLFAIYLE
jgi:sugar (pentulose or hexulose) kinase